MIIKPTKDGGLRVELDTPRLTMKLTVSRAADGKPLRIITADGAEVGTASIAIREPLPPDLEIQRQIAAAKQGGCCG